MSKKKGAAKASVEGRVVRVPKAAPRPLIDARLLLLAGLIASPAAYRSSQGLLPAGDAFDRFLAIAAGCIAISFAVRVIWPLVAGESKPSGSRSPGATATAATVIEPVVMDEGYAGLGDLDDLALPAVGSGLDLLEDGIDATALLDLDPRQR